MNNDIIIKGDTRILRPHEVKQLINAIPKNEYKEKFEALLFTGARYSEIKRLYDNKSWWHGNTIKVPSFKAKAKAIHKERYIRLNTQGQRAIEYFLRGKKPLPHYTDWYKNLKSWCKKAQLDPTGICCKTTRKTWESWLVSTYTNQLELIFLSQGHSHMVALKYYLMIPFTEQDKKDMLYYVDGWI